MKACPYCGHNNEEGATRCRECMTDFVNFPESGMRTCTRPKWTQFAKSYSYALCVSLLIQAACLVLCVKRSGFSDRMFCLSFGFYWLGSHCGPAMPTIAAIVEGVLRRDGFSRLVRRSHLLSAPDLRSVSVYRLARLRRSSQYPIALSEAKNSGSISAPAPSNPA